MGYTTEFTGQFDCYRADSQVAGEFLKAVYEGDLAALGVFADWLIDQGDPRGEEVSRLRAGSAEESAAFWRLFGLKPEHAAYLTKFNRTRRMKRDPVKAALLPDPVRRAAGLPPGEEGAYFVGAEGFRGQERDESILDYNSPPRGQPGLWCQWMPNQDGTALVWDLGEKFYNYVQWLDYLLEHFLAPWGYVLHGEVRWQGEESEDHGAIRVGDNRVSATPTPWL